MCVVLVSVRVGSQQGATYLDIHQVVHTNTAQLRELLPTLLQKRPNIISLLALSTGSTRAKFQSQV